MAEPFIGEIRSFGFNYAPRGWALCDGQLLSIQQNTALFALLGTTYGGDGRQTFALPDLRGRVGIHQGQGPGLSPYDIGEVAGSEAVSLTVGQMPQHSHTATASNAGGNSQSPQGAVCATDAAGGTAQYHVGDPNVAMSPAAIQASGGNLPHENRPPYLVLNFCIALEGIFPSRN